MAISTVYLRTIFYPENFPRTIEKSLAAAKVLKEEFGYDTIAFCGMSGAAIAFILAYELELPLLCVRKKGDSSHFSSLNTNSVLEGNVDTKKYLIVDDFVASGATVKYIMESIHQESPSADCVALLMYAVTGNSDYYQSCLDKRAWKIIGCRPENS